MWESTLMTADFFALLPKKPEMRRRPLEGEPAAMSEPMLATLAIRESMYVERASFSTTSEVFSLLVLLVFSLISSRASCSPRISSTSSRLDSASLATTSTLGGASMRAAPCSLLVQKKTSSRAVKVSEHVVCTCTPGESFEAHGNRLPPRALLQAFPASLPRAIPRTNFRL